MGEGKSNTCGIVGICIGWLIPLVGLILGIIALARREKTVALGIISIIESIIITAVYGSIFWVL